MAGSLNADTEQWIQ